MVPRAHGQDDAPVPRSLAAGGSRPPAGVPAVFLDGTVGVGKTTVLDHLGALWQQQGQPHQLVDLDQLRRTWPAPPDDPFSSRLAMANLAALRRNDPAPRGRAVALAGVLETGADRTDHERALGGPLVVVRLVARPEVIAGRLRRRHADPDDVDDLTWHLARAGELARLQDDAGIADHVVDVSDLTPREAAREVLRLVSAGRPMVRPTREV